MVGLLFFALAANAQTEDTYMQTIRAAMKEIIGKPTLLDQDVVYHHTSVFSIKKPIVTIIVQTKDKNGFIMHYEYTFKKDEVIDVLSPDNSKKGKIDFIIIHSKLGETHEMITGREGGRRATLKRSYLYIPFLNQGEENHKLVDAFKKLSKT